MTDYLNIICKNCGQEMNIDIRRFTPEELEAWHQLIEKIDARDIEAWEPDADKERMR